MRKLLLAATIIAVPVLGHAQITTISPAELASLAQAYQTAKATLSEAQGIYQQAMQTYQALSHGNFINSIAPQLETGQLNNPLGNVSSLTGALTGQGGTVPGAQAILSKTQLYNVPGGDQAAQLMNQRAQSLADIQALGLQGMQVDQQRIAGLDQIQSQLNANPDANQLLAIQARLQSELAIAHQQQSQLQQVAQLQQSLQYQTEQQDAQMQRKDADSWANATKGSLP